VSRSLRRKFSSVSFGLGAFFAGLIVNESDHSGRAAAELLPIQDAFAVLFFVSVGMLFDPSILVTQAPKVLSVTTIILLGKSLAAYLLVLALRYPSATALTVSASLAQIGEFSFILGEMGVALGLLPREEQSLIIAGALISITLNPLVFRAAGAIERRCRAPLRQKKPQASGIARPREGEPHLTEA
jgi:monovalent cation:H+ antiporter-2, CPA2 family